MSYHVLAQYTPKDIERMKSEFVKGMVKTKMLKIAPNPDELFKLKTSNPDGSPKFSPLFWSVQSLQSYPDLAHFAIPIMAWTIEGLMFRNEIANFNSIVGVPEGAKTSAANISYLIRKPLVAIRKEAKTHGQGGGRIIGELNPEDTVLGIEDVITTGMSIIGDCALTLRMETRAKQEKAGLPLTYPSHVKDVVVMLDREDGGRENLADGLYKFSPFGEEVIANPYYPNPIRLHAALTQTEAIKYWEPTTDDEKKMKPVVEEYLHNLAEKQAALRAGKINQK